MIIGLLPTVNNYFYKYFSEFIYRLRNYLLYQSALLFFHKNNALSSLSSTVLRVRGKITLDIHEINVHEHLIIYFDFDRWRKLILVLYLL